MATFGFTPYVARIDVHVFSTDFGQISTNGGSTWNDLTNSPPYSGVTTATLSLTNLTLAYNGYKYRCASYIHQLRVQLFSANS